MTLLFTFPPPTTTHPQLCACHVGKFTPPVLGNWPPVLGQSGSPQPGLGDPPLLATHSRSKSFRGPWKKRMQSKHTRAWEISALQQVSARHSCCARRGGPPLPACCCSQRALVPPLQPSAHSQLLISARGGRQARPQVGGPRPATPRAAIGDRHGADDTDEHHRCAGRCRECWASGDQRPLAAVRPVAPRSCCPLIWACDQLGGARMGVQGRWGQVPPPPPSRRRQLPLPVANTNCDCPPPWFTPQGIPRLGGLAVDLGEILGRRGAAAGAVC